MAKVTPRSKMWDAFSIYFRLKNSDENGMVKCYTCPKIAYWKGENMQAGHLLDGRYSSILVDEDGIRIQCYSCNCGKKGNKEVYVPKFIDEMGREFFDELCRKKWITVQYKKRDYEEMRLEYKQKAKQIAEAKGIIL